MPKPTETERCIESLIAIFQKYSGKDGNSCQLSKTEFLTFMNTELAAFTKNQKDPGVLDLMMKKLDLNSDGQLDFQEFLNLIGGLAIACHDFFLMSSRSVSNLPISLPATKSSRPPPPTPARSPPHLT
ncbi:protein S100-A11-like [Chionomys nivalis]|uniref:protein S100-A11-like n=1 Tax=Chionomys nivalis TaxID=269649 RepID=UPI0025934668|nr:protein S100-A11-like [Chionomys nivalis]